MGPSASTAPDARLEEINEERKAMACKKKWSELSRPQRTALAAAAALQFGLAGTAWWDLSRRPADAVRGSKAVWAFVIGINFFGPLAYLRFGRKQSAQLLEPAAPLP
ncbi:PLD nuclease N-terminal domain-containing protein [Amycolatopsis cynarae]|uniref:PLD nuclease N-terminal domain-containing protein n=1 Tax=Amycolatopsis cynarae TaxID=2995223 RepID=A0ABY7B9W9_9PSEU|nr:PLD nuclease N-terminal domain-containing protein [Amycolatopsis sp. HUAS 11-8]WAL68946.1 PLD nuclease N-terminal domain-containing protein [Amycolatopsis sp. HUAS 11-8]